MGTKYQVQPKWLIDRKDEGEIVTLPEDIQDLFEDPAKREQELLDRGAISSTIDISKIPPESVDFKKLEAEVKASGTWNSAYQKAKNSNTINTAYRATVEAVRAGNVEDLYFFAQDLIDVANTEATPFTASEIQSLNDAFDAAGLVGNLTNPNA
jgi:hypothetical protein